MTPASLAASDYEGWVCWLDDGSPLLEAVPPNAKLADLAAGARAHETRPEARSVLDWKHVPMRRVMRVELYFARDRYPNQPVIRLDREPGSDVAFIQMKMAGLAVGPTTTPVRTGLYGYRIGYWDRRARRAQVWEVTTQGIKAPERDEWVADPCAPRPKGWGYSRAVLGS